MNFLWNFKMGGCRPLLVTVDNLVFIQRAVAKHISSSHAYSSRQPLFHPKRSGHRHLIKSCLHLLRISLTECMVKRKSGSRMSTRDIEGEWRAASYFLAKGPSASVQYLHKDVKAQLFALKAQALDGDCPPGQEGSMALDPSLRIKQEAWNSLSGMSGEEAKRRYVDLLSEVLPEWKKWSADHGKGGEEHESEAERLVKAFKARLASSNSTLFSRL